MPGHWSRPDLKLITGSSSVGTQVPHAVGSALASKIRGEDEVTAVYFGDGATSKGDFHEALNFAGIHSLPVLFICENNQYAISVPFSKQSAVRSAADRAAGYNMPGVSFDGMDVLEAYQVTREYAERARRGGGPALLEAQVYRFSLHTSHVGMENYRSKQEIEEQRRRDPLPRFQRELEEAGILDGAQAARVLDEANREVDEAIAFAEASPLPDPATARLHVYKEPEG
jgi:2-oxoisovalerate dehydrogenase E1 component alpha subunit